MPEIFINYRTGDGEQTANYIESDLSRRFGSEHVFKDGKSIKAGEAFPQELLRAVRSSQILIAVIGERWLDAPSRRGEGTALNDPNDWTRRELIEALSIGSVVIPVLVGASSRLDRSALPPELAVLADHQYRTIDHSRHPEDALRRIGDDVAARLPYLEDRDAELVAAAPPEAGGVAGDSSQAATTAHTYRQDGGVGSVGRDFHGNTGTVIHDAHAPVNTGKGSQNTGPQFIGENSGVNYSERADFRGARQNFGRSRSERDED